ncbi:MAG: hypothetical protein JXR37_03785 [Kiritimatiellae bacterium]|nr:hypothetical protein [Kiritimatiellia bacterium]
MKGKTTIGSILNIATMIGVAAVGLTAGAQAPADSPLTAEEAAIRMPWQFEEITSQPGFRYDPPDPYELFGVAKSERDAECER